MKSPYLHQSKVIGLHELIILWQAGMTRFKETTQYITQPEICLYFCTHTHTNTHKTPFLVVPLPPSLPGSFAAPGQGDHGRDHHDIVFIVTTQQFLFFVSMTVKVLVMLG